MCSKSVRHYCIGNHSVPAVSQLYAHTYEQQLVEMFFDDSANTRNRGHLEQTSFREQFPNKQTLSVRIPRPEALLRADGFKNIMVFRQMNKYIKRNSS